MLAPFLIFDSGGNTLGAPQCVLKQPSPVGGVRSTARGRPQERGAPSAPAAGRGAGARVEQSTTHGDLVQWVERMFCTHEATGSSPVVHMDVYFVFSALLKDQKKAGFARLGCPLALVVSFGGMA